MKQLKSMDRVKIIAIMLLITVAGSFCSKQSIAKDWYLVGGNIQLEVDMNEGIFKLQEGSDTIFVATITELAQKEEGIQLALEMKEVGEPYKEKYKNMTQFIAWIYQVNPNQIKLLLSAFYNKPYYFTTHPSQSLKDKPIARFMGKAEYKNLQNSLGKNIFTQYQVNIASNYEGALSDESIEKQEKSGYRRWLKTKYQVPSAIFISKMIDYTRDLDLSSGFITKEEPENWTIQYTILNRNQGTPLNKNAAIRGMLINTGNLDNKSEYRKYKRPRTLRVYFASDYVGGLGRDLPNFNNVSYSFEIPNTEEPQVIVFYNLIYAKAISVYVDSYYLGEKNEASLFDLVFFTDSSVSS